MTDVDTTIDRSSSSDNKRLSVQGLTEIAQAVVREAPAADRRRLWAAYEDLLTTAQEEDLARMPWVDPSSVTEISWTAGKNLIASTVCMVTDDEIVKRLFQVAADTANRLDRDAPSDNRKPGKLGVRSCASPSCNATFSPRRQAALYCSPACRQAMHRARHTT